MAVNQFVDDQGEAVIPIHAIDENLEREQIAEFVAFKASRDSKQVAQHLEILRGKCRSSENMMPALIDAVDVGVSIGEVSEVFRECFGVYHDPGDI